MGALSGPSFVVGSDVDEPTMAPHISKAKSRRRSRELDTRRNRIIECDGCLINKLVSDRVRELLGQTERGIAGVC